MTLMLLLQTHSWKNTENPSTVPLKRRTAASQKNITPTPPVVNDRDDNGFPSLENIAKDFILENGAELSLDEARRVKENYLALLTKLEFQQKMVSSLK